MNREKCQRIGLDFLLIAALVAFDQFTKWLATVKLKGNPAFPLIDGVLELQYLENRGSAFGIMQGKRWLLLIVGGAFVLFLVFILIRLPLQKRFWAVHAALAGIIAGGLGNIIDRFRLGYVVDFISFVLIHYPIFNVADSYVVVSTIALFLLILFVYREDELEQMIGRKKKRDR